MKTAIFIKTYDRDMPWLNWCYKSIRKFVTGFETIHIAGPYECMARIRPKPDVETHITDDRGKNGYLYQQVIKMFADIYCGSVDFILYVDSDCFFTRPCHVSEFIRDGKPWAWHTPYEQLRNPDGRAMTPWQAITQKAIGRPVEHEFMRRFPIMWTPEIVRLAREHIELTHRINLEGYVMAQPRSQFSEFNAIGAWCYYHRPELATWHDTTKNECPAPWILQRDGSTREITASEKAAMEAILNS